MEIMARKDAVNGQKEGQYRKTSLDFFCYLSYLHPHLYLKDHNKNLSNQESKWLQHSHINVCNVTVTEIKFLELRTSYLTCSFQFSSVQSLGHVWHFAPPWTAACQASLYITNSQSLLKLMSFESVMPSNYLILCHPLLLPLSILPSIRVFSNESVLHIRVFSNESALHMRWPKYWSFSFSISPSNEHTGLVSFRMDWLDLLAVQETLKCLLQCHGSKASALWHSAFIIVQLSHPYMTTGKTIALTRWTLVSKVISLLFNMLSSLVITFLPMSKYLLISWLQSPSTVILEPRK